MQSCTQVRMRRWRAMRMLIAAAFHCAVIALYQPVAAQAPSGIIAGRVVTESGEPSASVSVLLDGTSRVEVTNEAGMFRFTGVAVGDAVLVVEQIGWRPVQRSVTVRSGETSRVEIMLEPQALLLDQMVVTTSREEQRRAETPATVHSVSGAEIDRLKPSHPSELMNRIPGVWVNVTGGEGHMAAIRHPMTTNPVYLYLENGVPTRSTGFFNHNALYEIDVPHAARVEVVKGPATALYGSDAIGGMVNVLTHSADDAPPVSLSAEGGAHGFGRVLASVAGHGVIGEVNVTRTDGWRGATAYDRQSGTLRWDYGSGATSVRTMLAYSRIDQNTAGSSALSQEQYETTPELNLTPISYRRVQAVRASVALEHLAGTTLLTVTPFARWNEMEMLPNWSLTYDPAVSLTGHASAGALLKVRRDIAPMRMRAIAGLDLDYSPGRHREWQVQTTRVDGVFTDFTRGDVIYDYDVAFHSISPYLQLEATPVENLRVVGGLRYDRIGYDYDNTLAALQTGPHRRPESTAVAYEHVSPKLGIVWSPSYAFRIFGSYGHGFRTPSEGQLFRQGGSLSTVSLRPVRADNLEVGIAGVLGARVSYDLAVYHMRKHDDLLTFTRPDGARESVNAGETLHRGVEAGLAIALPFELRLDLAASRAEHFYEEWSPADGTDYSGNLMESAPARTASAGLTWMPAQWERASAGIDVQHVGPYWMDAANTTRYDGHTTVTLRAEAPVHHRLSVFARMTNVLDARYAELAQYTAARGSEFAPGMPRALYAGVRFR